MRKNRTYPTYVNRNIPVPDWAQTAFVAKGLPPTFVFPIGSAKSIAKLEWTRQFGGLVPSDEAIKKFVFRFPWRWQGDHAHRYEVLARWGYEFMAETEKELARATARAKKDARAGRAERPDLESTELVDFEDCWDPDEDPVPALTLQPDRSAPDEIKRFILLNPPRTQRTSPKKPAR